ncbi:MAG: biotin--[acetyl-CoA-carboxylase] ligase, partial [Armatimonadota bacterium]
CARAIQATTGLEARTKWPNDVIVRGRKVGGVLREMEAEPDRIAAIVVGVGINVNGSPSDFGGEFHTPPTTVEDCLGAPADRLRVLCGLLEEMDALYDDYLAKGPHRLLTLWRGADIVMGRWVTAQTPRDTVQGMALDLDADGSLILQRRGGTTVRFVAGDVTINY